MPKIVRLFCFLAAALLAPAMNSHAEPTAANIFKSMGGTATMDTGGPIHSQARSIYSLGGGMATFQGKKITLLAVDPPSFSAGCTGISWHFGGFSFISADEIRRMVEAISQASLGIAIDLAMQTLCPQCYAVMTKLREMANMMRNAAANSCQVGKMLGGLLSQHMPSLFQPNEAQQDCSNLKTARGEADSSMMTQLGGNICAGLDSVMGVLKTAGNDVLAALNGDTSKQVSANLLQKSGNRTYHGLSALGYRDGFVKDVLMSYLGMQIVFPTPAEDCKQAFQNFSGTPKSASKPTFSDAELQTQADASAALSEPAPGMNLVYGNTDPVEAPTDDARPTFANHMAGATPDPDATGAKDGPMVCTVPPIISGTQAVGQNIVCGYNFHADAQLFDTKFPDARISDSTFYKMCKGVGKVAAATSSGALDWNDSDRDPIIFHCDGSTSECMTPKMMYFSEVMADSVGTEYTGMGWMIMDALYAGIDAVRKNNALPNKTIAVLNASGYPLYRLINMAAVYPGVAEEVLQSYAGTIAAQQVMETLTQMMRPGTHAEVRMTPLKAGPNIAELRAEIMTHLIRDGDRMKDETLKRLSEKRALVDLIMQINKSLQAEVVSQGLTGNNNLALSIRKQQQLRAALGNDGLEGVGH